MKKFINHLRRQPEETRRHILHILIFVVAIIMIIFWVFSLGTNLTSVDTQVKMKEDLKPFTVLKDNIVDGYKSTSETDSPETE
ncbi:MAG: hypothetical protein UR25_C0001G0059 [Candidatus Nomurabacteria bacterium GW2011_GWE1_32_28]|uniref:Uncharacterized protein n=1 Tax=Candidatus Nomurabacteria bacterium GW2011_GWF1_31_48 TaxID=1618767 RepID=A0A0F9YGW3_9BACT|nr:MAG: hypothetical protein UR10_C0001G0012 [Candidatus Nomurabacteria bacterium GW2011_GWF2_30_133]KKP28890.1 MAG: hypothetical protein UR18_C0001G0011 [Candidatus Nomurabacteria bacterium GW2011_GWE2_31_40]KKP30628.1 MAG: hypothetical protein UR19_C0001G0012 [Candidatus Nomurabacteria bacterium GW2011_GWF1_31_48]KKP35146.1 MAG: hypothetical protein UR25_C0001G0059 [Candidatus Nomurabacteria bacterium GW2011_GWE1_32_28]HAS80456.1 hypothetical protein [Candidatus Nomurabacteria bacterium]